MKRTVFVLSLILAGFFLASFNPGPVIAGEIKRATFVVR